MPWFLPSILRRRTLDEIDLILRYCGELEVEMLFSGHTHRTIWNFSPWVFSHFWDELFLGHIQRAVHWSSIQRVNQLNFNFGWTTFLFYGFAEIETLVYGPIFPGYFFRNEKCPSSFAEFLQSPFFLLFVHLLAVQNFGGTGVFGILTTLGNFYWISTDSASLRVYWLIWVEIVYPFGYNLGIINQILLHFFLLDPANWVVQI